MDSSVMEIIFTFIGGLGIFLYGIKQMVMAYRQLRVIVLETF